MANRLGMLLTCKNCKAPTMHTEVASVQSGRIFLSCLACETIQNLPETEEMRKARRG